MAIRFPFALPSEPVAPQDRVVARTARAQREYERRSADTSLNAKLIEDVQGNSYWDNERKVYVDKRGEVYAKTYEEKIAQDIKAWKQALEPKPGLTDIFFGRRSSEETTPSEPDRTMPKWFGAFRDRGVTAGQQAREQPTPLPMLDSTAMKTDISNNAQTTGQPRQVLHTGQTVNPMNRFSYFGGFGSLFNTWEGGFKGLMKQPQ